MLRLRCSSGQRSVVSGTRNATLTLSLLCGALLVHHPHFPHPRMQELAFVVFGFF